MQDDLAFAPWGIVSPDFWATATTDATRATGTSQRAADQRASTAHQAEPPQPPEFRSRIAAVTVALNSPDDKEQLTQAGIESERLDQEITARYGEAHPHTINIRELRGWLALLLEQPGVATRWHLHTVGLQTEVWGPTHQFTQGSAQRAVHAWLKIDDPQEGAVLGRELLAMLAAVLGEDSEVTRRALRRLEKITAQL